MDGKEVANVGGFVVGGVIFIAIFKYIVVGWFQKREDNEKILFEKTGDHETRISVLESKNKEAKHEEEN